MKVMYGIVYVEMTYSIKFITDNTPRIFCFVHKKKQNILSEEMSFCPSLAGNSVWTKKYS